MTSGCVWTKLRSTHYLRNWWTNTQTPILSYARQQDTSYTSWRPDAQKQFNSFSLAEGETQDMTTFWTPLGLMKFTRMIMGAKNSSSIAQAIYSRFMSVHLPV